MKRTVFRTARSQQESRNVPSLPDAEADADDMELADDLEETRELVGESTLAEEPHPAPEQERELERLGLHERKPNEERLLGLRRLAKDTEATIRGNDPDDEDIAPATDEELSVKSHNRTRKKKR